MAEKLIAYLQRRAGEYLRAVATYDEESYDIVHLRDDLPKEATQKKVDAIYDGVQSGLGPSEIRREIGERYATLQVREEAVVLNLPWSQSEGTLVSLEPEAARQLTGFLNECMEHGYRGSVNI